MDFLTYPYARDQHVIRAVYDDGKCVQMWKRLYEYPDQQLLESVVNTGLQEVFPDLKIPKPKKIVIKYVEGAWYFVHSKSQLSSKQIYDWSIDPFGDGSFHLAGDGFNLDGTAWCEGSLQSVMRIFEKFYPLNIKMFHL